MAPSLDSLIGWRFRVSASCRPRIPEERAATALPEGGKLVAIRTRGVRRCAPLTSVASGPPIGRRGAVRFSGEARFGRLRRSSDALLLC